jgi:hypothetical protein
MEAIFGKDTCSKCGYKHATHNVAKDGSNEFFLCERCGYQKTSSEGEEMEIVGAGSFSFVGENGIIAGGVFEKLETFFEKAEELSKSVQGAKLFYSKKDGDSGKYYLVNNDTKQQYEFGENDIICWDGLKKPESGESNLKVTYTKE